MKQRAVLILTDAEDDLREIRSYVHQASCSSLVADRYLSKIWRSLKTLEYTAEAQPHYYHEDESCSTYQFIPVQRHVAFFTFDESNVYVKRVLHHRMNYDVWLN